MIITNLETVPGKTVARNLGLVMGNTIRAKHVGRDIMAGLKNIVGGELRGYTELMAEAQRAPTAFMCAEALWWQCHRRLISDHLLVAGWTVQHIGRDGRLVKLFDGRYETSNSYYAACSEEAHAKPKLRAVMDWLTGMALRLEP